MFMFLCTVQLEKTDSGELAKIFSLHLVYAWLSRTSIGQARALCYKKIFGLLKSQFMKENTVQKTVYSQVAKR